MGLRRRSRGFTLIEMMITVAVVGVLSLLAVVAYRRWVKSSYITEAQGILSSVRQGEERFAGENGGYLDVTGAVGVGNDYPLQTPTNKVTGWGGSCTWCKTPSGFNTLGVTANAPVIFGYSVVADSTKTPSSRGVSVTLNGKAFDFSGLVGGAPWYFAEADANTSGDTTSWVHVYALSGTNQMFTDGEGN
ncbi:MAG TPA: prepilin-type N-terminal cleavage/methylation domain-containing protein [Polyangiaceae bacterium]|jgi:prepilin-type N-terminal cleavage/methylation domain-containing protein